MSLSRWKLVIFFFALIIIFLYTNWAPVIGDGDEYSVNVAGIVFHLYALHIV